MDLDIFSEVYKLKNKLDGIPSNWYNIFSKIKKNKYVDMCLYRIDKYFEVLDNISIDLLYCLSNFCRYANIKEDTIRIKENDDDTGITEFIFLGILTITIFKNNTLLIYYSSGTFIYNSETVYTIDANDERKEMGIIVDTIKFSILKMLRYYVISQ